MTGLTTILEEAPTLSAEAWEAINRINWDAPARSHYQFRKAVDLLSAGGNTPRTAQELFGDVPALYRNGPEKMNEILRTTQTPYRLRRVKRPGLDELRCEAGERLFAFAPA